MKHNEIDSVCVDSESHLNIRQETQS